jgi:D-alanine--poly(phosphoribitol) ligase subunit 1
MDFVRDEKINFIMWVPSVLINVANLEGLNNKSLPHLKTVLFAGEVMPNKQLNYWRKNVPHANFGNLYGPTEITVIACHYPVDRLFADNEALPIGFPCRNCDLLVINSQNERARADEEGELCVRGTSLALGYWKDLEKTETVFVQNPLHNNYPDRIYRTGDLVKYNSRGEIVYIGRKDTQIKHMGYRIELGEVENAAQSLSGVANCCALYDSFKKEIVLFYEPRQTLEEIQVRAELTKLLPKYMLPTRIVQVEQMPTNANGKVDRPRLSQIHFESKG